MNLNILGSPPQSSLTIVDLLVSLSLSFICGIIVALTYRITHSPKRGCAVYSQTFVHTLIVLCMIISVVVLVVGSNIARAFALLGALSIIRFRNSLRQTRDIGFVFLVVAIGMACGARFYLLTIITTIVICVIVILLGKLNLFTFPDQRITIAVKVPSTENLNAIKDKLSSRFCDVDFVEMVVLDDQNMIECIYSIKSKEITEEQIVYLCQTDEFVSRIMRTSSMELKN